MTTKEIRNELKTLALFEGQKIVDIDTDNLEHFVIVIAITKKTHTVYRYIFTVNDNKLKFFNSEVF